MSKEKEKAFPEKLKHFFKLQRSGNLNFSKPVVEEFVITDELLQEISQSSPLNLRTKVLKDLCEVIKKKRINNISAVRVWETIKDLLFDEVPKEYRHLCLHFLECLCSDPSVQNNSILRPYFFDAMKCHELKEDLLPKLEVIRVLTDNGKDLDYLEDDVGQFLVDLFPQLILSSYSIPFLPMLVNVIKFHTAYLGENVIAQNIHNTCYLCCRSNNIKEKELCLDVFDAVVCYSYLPPEVLPDYVTALCRTVNTEQLCQKSWKVMLNLLGTYLGHSTLCTLCSILQDDKLIIDSELIRGAVFFISNGLWGKKKLALKHSPAKVLPSIKMALRSPHRLVVFEVCLGVLGLIKKLGDRTDEKLGDKTDSTTWSNILDIVIEICDFIEKHPECGLELVQKFHEILTCIEFCYENKRFPGSLEIFFNLIERCSKERDDKSIIYLLHYKATSLMSDDDCIKLTDMTNFIEQFFKQENRQMVRLKCLDVVFCVLKNSRDSREDEILEHVVTKCLNLIDQDSNVVVREHAIKQLLIVLEDCNPKQCLAVYDIFDKILDKPFETLDGEGSKIVRETETQDIVTLVDGLIMLLQTKLDICSADHTIRQYKCLIKHLIKHYEKPVVFESGTAIKLKIFQCIMKMRASQSFHLGFPGTSNMGQYKYSITLVIKKAHADESSSPTIFMSIAKTYQALVLCLKNENDWTLIGFVLNSLPEILQHSALILSQKMSDVDLLASTVCSLVSDPVLMCPEKFKNVPDNFTRADFHRYVYLSLGFFSSYGRYMLPTTQQLIVKCLLSGLVSKSCQPCVSALTICILEMRVTMHKLLHSVLFRLSQISATVTAAQTVLEFLSTLIRLPEVYQSCVEEQYMEIFAIALPYTNPFKFKHYIVSQAYQTLALWFLRCRQPYRRKFVKFILKGLEGNVLSSFDFRSRTKTGLEKLNEDSAHRRRSASMVERSTRQKTDRLKPPIDESNLSFHKELTEACLDFMSRYAFATVSTKPQRFPIVDFLLSSGQSKTWLLGNKLITITTSGCLERPMQNGMCEKCYLTCNKQEYNSNISRRRHMSAFVSTSTPQAALSHLHHSKDDLHMQHTKDCSLDSQTPNLNEQVTWEEDEEERTGRNATLCSCLCQGYAEIYIRRPTGDVSWVMQIQNTSEDNWGVDAMSDITEFLFPSADNDNNFELLTRKRIDSENVDEKVYEEILNQIFQADYSSPGMSSKLAHTRGDSLRTDLLSPQHDLLHRSVSTPEKVHASTGDPQGGKSGIKEPVTKDSALQQAAKNQSQTQSSVFSKGIKTGEKSGQSNNFVSKFMAEKNDLGTVLPLVRERSATTSAAVQSDRTSESKVASKSGISPSFVFLQLYYGSGGWSSEKDQPILLPDNSKLERTLKVLDMKKPYETHKFGVVYIAPGQPHVESEILSNQFGSYRYTMFLQNLGELVKLSDVDPQSTFLGGLEQSGKDGHFAFKWSEDIIKIIFHVATLMPNYPEDKSCNRKKRHIGNDYVVIVYNESGQEFDIQTLKGQLLHACIVIEPMNYNYNRVKLIAKPEIQEELEVLNMTIASDDSLAIRTRGMALRTNLCAMIQKSKMVDGQAYASNWLERLRHIKRLKDFSANVEKSPQGAASSQLSSSMDDFTVFV